MKLKTLLALLLSLCIFLPALAQTKPASPSPTLPDDKDDIVKITTNLVQVDAVVTKDGKPVTNLTADDFELFEDGRPQTITSFAYISNVRDRSLQPSLSTRKSADGVPFATVKRDEPHRIMALVVDDLGLSAESMHQTKRQLKKFIAEELQPNDLVAIMRTSGELGALQQFTNDKRLLNRAVDQLRWNFCSRVGINVLPLLAPSFLRGHDEDWNHCGGLSFNQTMKSLRFILDAMGHLPGRKSMVLFSDSIPRQTQEPETNDDSPRSPSLGSLNYAGLLQRIAEKAIRASVVIYSVDTQGLQYTGITAADNVSGSRQEITRAMNQALADRSMLLVSRREGGEMIARQTGGFQIRNSNDFELDRILNDQSGYYLLGYRPTDETFNRRFHHIKAKVKRSGMTLRTRFGFMGVSEEEVKGNQPPPIDKTNLALASPFGAQDIELDLMSFFVSDNAAGSLVRSFVYISAKDLTFASAHGRYEGSIELHGVIFGDNGSVVEQLTHGATLSLSEDDYKQAMSDGMSLTFDIPVKRPGFYQVRVAVRDRTSSQIGSVGQFVSVPNLNNKRPAVSGVVLGGAAADANQAITNPSARIFAPNDTLYFAYMIYNAAQLVNPVMEVGLFSDGKKVYSGPEVPIQTAGQPDPNRVSVNGSLRLNAGLEPGSYYLQIVITDKGAKNKTAPLMQWVEFEVVKL